MILIITSCDDSSTFHVIDWICHFKKQFIIINETTKVDLLAIELGNNIENKFSISIQNNDERSIIHSNCINSYWYRRHKIEAVKIKKSDHVYLETFYHLKHESDYIHEYLNYALNNKKNISSYNTQNINKLKCLDIASKVGLTIPETLIATTKKQIIALNKKHKLLNTKAIQVSILFNINNFLHYNYNNTLDNDTVTKIPSSFFPSKIQQYIEKKIELRIFYLHGKCYAMAIFSQQNEKTKVDFRRNNGDKLNRYVTYKLPKLIERKIIRFMKKVELNSGSIDMILTTDNQYVFLEVNPIGQFGFVSRPCNYNLEMRIADFLK